VAFVGGVRYPGHSEAHGSRRRAQTLPLAPQRALLHSQLIGRGSESRRWLSLIDKRLIGDFKSVKRPYFFKCQPPN
jgi:hypothetical protein